MRDSDSTDVAHMCTVSPKQRQHLPLEGTEPHTLVEGVPTTPSPSLADSFTRQQETAGEKL